MSAPRRPASDPRGDARAPASARAGHPASPSPAPDHRAAPRHLESEALFGSDDVVFIRHAGEVYRLQRTRLGKLILTK